MSKAVLISIHPEWCERIANGKKTLEVRKTRPKLDTPFKCYIYCTAGNLSYPVKNGMVCHNNGGKVVIGEFMCDSIRCFDVPYPAFQKELDKSILEQSCLTYYQLHRYAYHDALFGWHISDLVIYDTPKELGEFIPVCRYGQGGECEGVAKVYCPFQKRDYNPDGSINIVDCTKRVSGAPQSWCYVEELAEGGTDDG